MRVRGLKLPNGITSPIRLAVAPYVGAWVEIMLGYGLPFLSRLSHPMWVRGLKFNLS